MNTADQITAEMLAYWENAEGIETAKTVVMHAPAGQEAVVIPCPTVHTTTDHGLVVRVPWVLFEIDLAHLAQGGTLWLSTWGGLPPHSIEVQEPVR